MQEEQREIENTELENEKTELSGERTEIGRPEETVSGDKTNHMTEKPRDAWRIPLGILIGVVISLFVFILWRGYFAVPIPGLGMVTVKLPTYGLFGESASVIDTQELNRKMDEIDYYMDTEYYYEKDTEDLLDAAVAGLYSRYTSQDDYAEYFTSKEYMEQMSEWSGSFVGIGIYVTKDEDTGGVYVVRTIKGGPSVEAGLESGDIIIAADGVDLTEMDLDTAVADCLKGEEGTFVHLDVLRDGHKIEFTVERRTVETESVYYSVMEYGGKRIGYLYITSFLATTINGFTEAIDFFEADGVDGIVVDLRDNGGGDMNTCLDMCDYLLPDDIATYSGDDLLPTNQKRTRLLTVQGKNDYKEHYYADDGHSVDLPLVVLVNGYSASASEIFAGVMHSYGYRICGLNTYGKGIVQTVRMLYDMSGIKYTSAEYVLPDSSRIHGVGIAPDVTVEPTAELEEKGANPEQPDPSVDNMLEEAIRMLGENN